MERIDSYMSSTYLGRMRAAGQIQKAPISKTFFEKNKRNKKKKKKGAKTGAKSDDSNLTQLEFLIEKEYQWIWRDNLRLSETFIF